MQETNTIASGKANLSVGGLFLGEKKAAQLFFFDRTAVFLR